MIEIAPQRAGGREVAAVALGLGVIVLAALAAMNGWIVFTRPLWVDEWFTVLVASHVSPLDVVADLRAGADGGASLYHLTAWALHAAGALHPVGLRVMSLAMVVAALTLTYAVLRRRFSVDAGAVGALAAGSNAVVLTYAFDGRFYGLWLLCCALYAHALGARRFRTAYVATASVLLVASHWYGVITLSIMAGAVLLQHGRRWREGLRAVAPSAAGLVTLALIAPLARGQRAAISVNSWIPDFTTRQIAGVTN